ncbi:MAG: CmcJ/NvfI family oxidoreductase [Alphaproteobacteria bacterium]
MAAERIDAVTADLTFLVPDGTKPQIIVPTVAGVETGRQAKYAARRVTIADGRPLIGRLSVDVQGFDLVSRPTAMPDFGDDAAIKAAYYPEVEALLKDALGVAEVLIFDHTIRIDDTAKGTARGARKPVRTVHNDYTPVSGPQRVRDLVAPDRVDAWLGSRFAIFSVWRPITGPVETAPLGVADSTTLTPSDLVAADLVYTDRTGEIYDIAWNAAQRWYYFPRMTRDEVMLLKTYDSATDGTARFSAHSAFDDPTTPANARPRESIEVRALVRYPAA